MKLYTELFGFSVPSYGLMIIIGVILANALAFLHIYISKKREEQLDSNDLLVIEAYCILGGFLGAKLLYVIVSFQDIDWHTILTAEGFNAFMRGGFVFYGGLIGGLLTLMLAGKLHHINVKLYLNEFIFLLPMVHGFGRIGCFMAGCCYGAPYEGIGAVVFPEGSAAIPGIKLFPIQLVEAIGLFCIFGILLVLKMRQHGNYTVLVYCVLYAILRFVLEFYRYDEARGRLWLLSTSQWISLAMVVGVIVLLGSRKMVKRQQNK